VNSDCPQHYALNASGKEEINFGSISASGPKRRLRVGQSMSALPGYFRRQLVPLLPGRHLLRCPGI
jgi:hypothetical protein